MDAVEEKNAKEKKEDKEESLRRGLLELCVSTGKKTEDHLFFTLDVERQTLRRGGARASFNSFVSFVFSPFLLSPGTYAACTCQGSREVTRALSPARRLLKACFPSLFESFDAISFSPSSLLPLAR